MKHGRVLLIVAAVLILLLGLQFVRPVLGGRVERVMAQSAPREIKPPMKPASSWFAVLNPQGTIYDRGFKAFYFDRTNNGSQPFIAYSESVAVKYAWSELHQIPSEHFAGYWIGQISFDQQTVQQISVSTSWAKARIFIDGQIVNQGEAGQFVHSFAAGTHLIEVEYINNWHTTEFKVTFDEVSQVLPLDEVGSQLRQGKAGQASIYYVGLYESARQDTSVDVALPASREPIVVWLDSYEAIDWKLTGKAPVAAVVLASYKPGSRVTGAGSAKILLTRNRFGVHDFGGGGCSCVAGNFHCEQSGSLADVSDRLMELTGRGLSGVVGEYSASSVSIAPFGILERAKLKRLGQDRQKAQQQCRQQADPNFDSMLQD